MGDGGATDSRGCCGVAAVRAGILSYVPGGNGSALRGGESVENNDRLGPRAAAATAGVPAMEVAAAAAAVAEAGDWLSMPNESRRNCVSFLFSAACALHTKQTRNTSIRICQGAAAAGKRGPTYALSRGFAVGCTVARRVESGGLGCLRAGAVVAGADCIAGSECCDASPLLLTAPLLAETRSPRCGCCLTDGNDGCDFVAASGGCCGCCCCCCCCQPRGDQPVR